MARAKTTRKLTGRALSRYFDGVLEAEAELAVASKRRVLDLLEREVAQVRIRMSAPARRRSPASRTAQSESEVAGVSPPGTAAAATEPAKPVAAEARAGTAPSTGPERAPDGAPVTAPQSFNPYQFSAVAVMTRGGRDALLARLAQIAEPANLRKFASAQHIAVPADATTVEQLCDAIVEGAARRIADRRAAAS